MFRDGVKFLCCNLRDFPDKVINDPDFLHLLAVHLVVEAGVVCRAVHQSHGTAHHAREKLLLLNVVLLPQGGHIVQKSAQPLGQIGREIAWFQRTYHAGPKVFLAYDRAAFSGVDDPAVRITFDTDIRWRTTALDLRRGDYGAPLLPPEQILMELKLPGTCPLWLSHALTDIDARPTSFSKYGACYKTYILPNESFSKEALCSA